MQKKFSNSGTGKKTILEPSSVDESLNKSTHYIEDIELATHTSCQNPHPETTNELKISNFTAESPFRK
jgi:hypothetical protein